MSTEKEKNLKIGERLLAETKKEIEKMFLDCANCTEDKHFSKPEERCFTFSWKRHKVPKFLHVRVTISLKKFSHRDPEMPDDGLRRLTIKFDITDRYGDGNGEIVFSRSTSFGTSTLNGSFGVLTMARQWLNGFVRDQELEEADD